MSEKIEMDAIAVTLKGELGREVRKLAREDDRPAAAFVRRLVKEALSARQARAEQRVAS